MTKAQNYAMSLSAAEISVLLRMEADYAIAPGAWTFAEYEAIERSPKLYKPVFVSRDLGFGHTLTAFGRRVQAFAKG